MYGYRRCSLGLEICIQRNKLNDAESFNCMLNQYESFNEESMGRGKGVI